MDKLADVILRKIPEAMTDGDLALALLREQNDNNDFVMGHDGEAKRQSKLADEWRRRYGG